MRIQQVEGSAERRILIGMIVSPRVLGTVASQWSPEGRFRAKWSNLIGSWCVQFFRKYDQAPGQLIQSIYESWATRMERDSDTLQMLDRFLNSLNDEYVQDDVNENYLVDLAGGYFNEIGMRQLADDLRNDLDAGRPDAAIGRISNYAPINLGVNAGIDVLRDMNAIRAVFEKRQDALITYPDDLGKFYGRSFGRDCFIAFEGSDKRGKTYHLLDAAWRAMGQHRKVAFFEIGDMSQDQIMERFVARAARRPLRAQVLRWPTAIVPQEKGVPTVQFAEKQFAEAMTWKDAWHACEKVVTSTKTSDCLLKLVTHPAASVTVAGIEQQMLIWDREGWRPDICVIDYADLLAPMPGGPKDPRDQSNDNWVRLRALSQKYHILVLTATQANAAAYRAHTLTREHFGNDKRKLAIVTGMIGINQTPEESVAGLQRMNWIVRREEAFYEMECCHIAPCLAIANPIAVSKKLGKITK